MPGLKKASLAMLAGAILAAPISLHADDEDDDDDWEDCAHYSRMERAPDYIFDCPCAAPLMPAPDPAPPARSRWRSAETFPKETPTQRVTAKERQLELLEKELADERRLFSKAAAAGAHENMECIGRTSQRFAANSPGSTGSRRAFASAPQLGPLQPVHHQWIACLRL